VLKGKEKRNHDKRARGAGKEQALSLGLARNHTMAPHRRQAQGPRLCADQFPEGERVERKFFPSRQRIPSSQHRSATVARRTGPSDSIDGPQKPEEKEEESDQGDLKNYSLTKQQPSFRRALAERGVKGPHRRTILRRSFGTGKKKTKKPGTDSPTPTEGTGTDHDLRFPETSRRLKKEKN